MASFGYLIDPIDLILVFLDPVGPLAQWLFLDLMGLRNAIVFLND